MQSENLRTGRSTGGLGMGFFRSGMTTCKGSWR
jgi:hypothetical protein